MGESTLVAIRDSVLDRFSATRMADGYEALYWRILAGGASGDSGDDRETVVEMASRRSGSAS